MTLPPATRDRAAPVLEQLPRCLRGLPGVGKRGIWGQGRDPPRPEDAPGLGISATAARDENEPEAGLQRCFSCKTLRVGNGTSAAPLCSRLPAAPAPRCSAAATSPAIARGTAGSPRWRSSGCATPGLQVAVSAE